MAMSKVIVEEDCLKEDVDLKSVKRLIEEQEPKYGLKKCDTPLFQWPILDYWGKYGLEKSDLFIIGRDVYIGQLTLKSSEYNWNVTLDLSRLTKNRSKEEEDTFHSFQHFICKLKYHNTLGKFREELLFSKNAFIVDTKNNEIHFDFILYFISMNKVLVEVYVEPSTTSTYVSPSKNAVVGKIEKIGEKRNLVFEKKMLVVSPRFDFGSADQKMIVSFWHAQQGGGWGNNDCLWVTLRIISEKKVQVGPPFSLKVSFTIFSQIENESDFIKKIVLRGEENKCEYPILLGFDKDLKKIGCLEKDILYYRVVVEPFNFKLPDETVERSK